MVLMTEVWDDPSSGLLENPPLMSHGKLWLVVQFHHLEK